MHLNTEVSSLVFFPCVWTSTRHFCWTRCVQRVARTSATVQDTWDTWSFLCPCTTRCSSMWAAVDPTHAFPSSLVACVSFGCLSTYLFSVSIYQSIYLSPFRSSETLPDAARCLPGVSHANVSPSCYAPAAQPAKASGPWSHEGGLHGGAGSQPGGLLSTKVYGLGAKQLSFYWRENIQRLGLILTVHNWISLFCERWNFFKSTRTSLVDRIPLALTHWLLHPRGYKMCPEHFTPRERA